MRKWRHDIEYRALVCARFLELEAPCGEIPRVDRFMAPIVDRIHREMNTICRVPSARTVRRWLHAATVAKAPPLPPNSPFT